MMRLSLVDMRFIQNFKTKTGLKPKKDPLQSIQDPVTYTHKNAMESGDFSQGHSRPKKGFCTAAVIPWSS